MRGEYWDDLMMKWFKKTKSQAWTAICSTANRTSISQVLFRSNAKPLINFADVDVGDISSPVSIKAIVKRFNLKTKRCVFVLDYDDYQMLQLEKLQVPDAEQTQAIAWKLKDLIDYSVENATVDYVDIPTDPHNGARQKYVYAFSARNQDIGKISNDWLSVGVRLKTIDARVMAQRNLAKLFEVENRGLAMLSMDGSRGLLTFTSGGELYHARRIDIDFSRSDVAYERLALELQRSLDAFERQIPYVSLNKLIVAPFDKRNELMVYLKTSFYLPIETFNLQDVCEFDAGVQLDDLNVQSKILPVVGAALREEFTL